MKHLIIFTNLWNCSTQYSQDSSFCSEFNFLYQVVLILQPVLWYCCSFSAPLPSPTPRALPALCPSPTPLAVAVAALTPLPHQQVLPREKVPWTNRKKRILFTAAVTWSLWRNWLARSAVNRKVGGSSPPRDGRSFSPCLKSLYSPQFKVPHG